MAGVEYTIIGILFMIVGIGIQKRLKTYFPKFYQENSKMTWRATFALFLSLTLSGILNLLFEIDLFRKAIYEYVQYWNVTVLIFGTMVPACFQLSTLVFGYIRKKNDDKHRLFV
jgi:formate hydrogenlyase subunit 3/multisubunit Na+/H+ antiporter MnhD subunit